MRVLSCSQRITTGYGGRILRGVKEAFREGHPVNNKGRMVFSRGAATTRGGVGSEVVVDRSGPSPGRPRSSSDDPSGSAKAGNALGLKEFMHRTRVLELYRGILKRARAIEDKDVATEARRQFKSCSGETDPLKVKMLVADATNYLEAMQGSTRGGGSAGDGESWLDIDDPEDKRGRVGEGFPWQR